MWSSSQAGEYLDAAHLVVSEVPQASLDLSLEGETWRRVTGVPEETPATTTTITVSCACLFLSAVAEVRLGCREIRRREGKRGQL